MGFTQVSTDGIKDDGITAGKIPANAVAASELADNAVDTNAIQNSAVTTAKIADDAVTSAKIASNSVTNDSINNNSIHGDKLTTQTVTLAKLVHGTSSEDGKFLRANNGADPTFETVNTDLVADTSPQLGGDLASNGNDILLADTDKIKLGTGNDLIIHHDGNNSFIDEAGTGDLLLTATAGSIQLKKNTGEKMLQANVDGAVELYHDNAKKAETVSGGFTVSGTCTATAFAGDGSALTGIAGIPTGVIVLWSGAANAIPSGYVLCDGNNSTPDLRDRFIVGAGNSYSVGDTGGASSVTLTVNQIPSHNHTIGGVFSGGDGFNAARSSSSSSGNVSTSSTGGGQSHENRPPYYALCYIMKT